MCLKIKEDKITTDMLAYEMKRMGEKDQKCLGILLFSIIFKYENKYIKVETKGLFVFYCPYRNVLMWDGSWLISSSMFLLQILEEYDWGEFAVITSFLPGYDTFVDIIQSYTDTSYFLWNLQDIISLELSVGANDLKIKRMLQQVWWVWKRTYLLRQVLQRC